MGILDSLKDTAAQLAESPVRLAVYARQLARGNRTPPAGALPEPGADQAGAEAEKNPVPVLLLQGYLANRGSVHLLARRLHARGHVVMTYKLGRLNTGDIRDTAGLVARKVESIFSQTPVEKIDVVGHSMGGLVGLYYVLRLGGRHRVRRLILLGTPASGTWTAVLGLLAAPLGTASRQLLPGSELLRELRETPRPPEVEIVTVGGSQDFFAPVRSTVLDGARHLTVPTTHSGLLVEKEVANTLDGLLRASGPPEPV